MPCYTVQTCSVSLENINLDRLEKVMKKLGYTVTRTAKGLSFSKGGVTGTFDGKKVDARGKAQSELYSDINAIKRAYSKDVVEEKGAKYRQKGWYLVKKDNETYTLQRTAPSLRTGL
jgi:hypothetical protein